MRRGHVLMMNKYRYNILQYYARSVNLFISAIIDKSNVINLIVSFYFSCKLDL